MHHSMVGPDDLTRRGKRMRAARQWAPVGIVVVLGVLLAREVSAWGDTGPQILGEIAFQELHLQARAAVTRLLQHDADFATLATAWPWPDHPRKRAGEHFVNLPRAAAQLEHNACPSDVPCVVTAIAQDVETLAPPRASEPEKLAALTLLGHWVGECTSRSMSRSKTTSAAIILTNRGRARRISMRYGIRVSSSASSGRTSRTLPRNSVHR